MSETAKLRPDRSRAREAAVQFLYQCECEKIFHFPATQARLFIENFSLPEAAQDYFIYLVRGVFTHLNTIDELLQQSSKHWRLERMGSTDRQILRVATFELMENKISFKVVINEAIELAKRYGSEHSGSFVNAVLDHIRMQFQKQGD